MKRHQLDGDVGNGGGIRGKASAQRIKIGQPAGIEIGLDECGEFCLAGAIMGQRQQPYHGAAGPLFGVARQQRLENALIGAARKELLAVDQVEQGHRFATQRMDDVP